MTEDKTLRGIVYRLDVFTAPWCKLCPIVGQALDKWQGQRPDVLVHRHNIEETEEMELASQYSVMALPTILISKGTKLNPINQTNSVAKLDKLCPKQRSDSPYPEG